MRGRHLLGLLLLLATIALPRMASAQAMDHYTLIMGFLPGKCLQKPELPLCAGLTLKDPAARNLTLIGLRPDAKGGSVPLEDCDPMAGAFSLPTFEGEIDDAATRACKMPAVKLSPDLARSLAEIMPTTAQCAERQFWSRYGACSMLSEESYFQRAVGRAKDMQRTLLNVTIAGAIGTRIKRDALIQSFAEQFGDEASQSALQLVCARSKKRSLPVLIEVRIKLRQLGTMRTLAKDGLWQEPGNVLRQRCPEEFLVPEAGQPVPDPVAKPEVPGTIPPVEMPVIPQPVVPQVAAPTIEVPQITAPAKPIPGAPDPTKPQPMDTEPMEVIPPLPQ
jgi:ribonuclease I